MHPNTPDGKAMLASAVFLSLCAIVLMVLGGWRRWVGIATLLFVLVCAILYLLRRYRKKDADAPEAIFPATPTPSPVWPTSSPSVPQSPPPPLSAKGRAEAEKWLDKLHQAGILAPERPSVDALAAALADYGEPVDMDEVLNALLEAPWYVPDYQPERYLANLRFHEEQVEQSIDSLRSDIEDLFQLAQWPDFAIEQLAIAPADAASTAPQIHLHLRIGTQPLAMTCPFFSKYHNASVYVGIARALRSVEAPRRLAWYYHDSGFWLSGLAGEQPLAHLPQRSDTQSGWQWLDEAE